MFFNIKLSPWSPCPKLNPCHSEIKHFQVAGNFNTSIPSDLQIILTLQGQMQSMNVLLVPDFSRFSSVDSRFQVRGLFKISAPNESKLVLSCKESGNVHISFVSPWPKFQPPSLFHEPFPSYTQIWYEWPQSRLERYKFKGTLHPLYVLLMLRFALGSVCLALPSTLKYVSDVQRIHLWLGPIIKSSIFRGWLMNWYSTYMNCTFLTYRGYMSHWALLSNVRTATG